MLICNTISAVDSSGHAKPIDIIEAFISDLEAFRAKHCNPDKPAGWLPRERWGVAKNRAEQHYPGVELVLIEACGWEDTHHGVFSWLGQHLKQLQHYTEILQRNYPQRDLDDERRFRAIYRTREWQDWKDMVRDLVREPAATDGTEARDGCNHGPDYRSVQWHGCEYSFTPTQAAIVKLLWEANEQGTPDVGDAALLEAADSETARLVDIFRNCPAWGSMIVPGKTKGTRRLAPPPDNS